MFPLLPSLPQGPRLPAGLNAAKIGPLLNMLLLLWIIRIFLDFVLLVVLDFDNVPHFRCY